MRQGRFHLISQEVEAARAKLELHMAAEVTQKLRRHRQKQRVSLVARQEEWLGLAVEVLGAEAGEQLAERLAEVDARRVLTDSDDEGDDEPSGSHQMDQQHHSGPEQQITGQQGGPGRSGNGAGVPSLPGIALLGAACNNMPSSISSLLPEELDSEDGSRPATARRR